MGDPDYKNIARYNTKMIYPKVHVYTPGDVNLHIEMGPNTQQIRIDKSTAMKLMNELAIGIEKLAD